MVQLSCGLGSLVLPLGIPQAVFFDCTHQIRLLVIVLLLLLNLLVVLLRDLVLVQSFGTALKLDNTVLRVHQESVLLLRVVRDPVRLSHFIESKDVCNGIFVISDIAKPRHCRLRLVLFRTRIRSENQGAIRLPDVLHKVGICEQAQC